MSQCNETVAHLYMLFDLAGAPTAMSSPALDVQTARVTIPCKVQATPKPSITWLKDGVPLSICYDKQVLV